jgi:hypothetical protein
MNAPAAPQPPRSLLRGRTFLCGALGAALAASVAILVARTPAGTAEAQDAGASLIVSGMRIDGARAKARIRLRNTSPNVGDVMFLRYTVRGPDAGAPLSLPGAGDVGLPLPAGQVVEIDLDAAVQSYRRSLGLGPYAGPVQFVSFGYGGVTRSFGPDTVVVDAQQTEGKAVFDAVVEWR